MAIYIFSSSFLEGLSIKFMLDVSGHNVRELAPKSKKSKIIFILKIIIAVALLVVLVNFFSVDEIVKALGKADWRYILLVFLLSILNHFLQCVKWHKFLAYGIGGVAVGDSLRSYLAGLTAGIVTPARIGEHVGRAMALKKYKFSNVIVVSAIDKVFNIVVIASMGILGTIIFYGAFSGSSLKINGWIIFVLSFLVIALVVVLSGKGLFLGLLKRKFSKYDIVENNLDVLENIFRSGLKKKSVLFGINILYYLIILLQFALLCVMLGTEVPIFSIMLIFSLVLLATTVILPISFSDLGVRESVASYLITLIGINSVIGFDASILLFLINILIPSLIGFISLIKK